MIILLENEKCRGAKSLALVLYIHYIRSDRIQLYSIQTPILWRLTHEHRIHQPSLIPLPFSSTNLFPLTSHHHALLSSLPSLPLSSSLSSHGFGDKI